MYGTIARVEINPANIEALHAVSHRIGIAPGQIGRYVFQMDNDPAELFLVALFESREAYWNNARSPEQGQRYQELRALLQNDPEWHDGAIIDAAGDVAQPQANHTIIRRVYDELINQENASVIDEVFAPEVIVHDPFSGTSQGVDAFRQLLGMFDAAFPHHRVAVERMISQGDLIAVLHTHTATNTGSFMGLPPTERTVVVNGLELFRMRDGKIVEFWRKDDDVSMLMQLGILAAPQPA